MIANENFSVNYIEAYNNLVIASNLLEPFLEKII